MKTFIFLLIAFTSSAHANIVEPNEESLEQDLKFAHTVESNKDEEKDQKAEDREVASETEKEKQDSIIKFWSY